MSFPDALCHTANINCTHTKLWMILCICFLLTVDTVAMDYCAGMFLSTSVISGNLCCLCHAGSAECRPSSAEWQVWKKSLQCPGFPHRDVIDEFLCDKDKLPTHALVWKRPKMFHLMVMDIHSSLRMSCSFELSWAELQQFENRFEN